jgi:hypothetical protein
MARGSAAACAVEPQTTISIFNKIFNYKNPKE